jgi:hypothetical protein
MSASQAERRGFNSHRPLQFSLIPPPFLAIFFLQGRFLYVKNRLKFEWFVFEWARFAHFFILKAGQRHQA